MEKKQCELGGGELGNGVKSEGTEWMVKGVEVEERRLVVGAVVYEFERVVIGGVGCGKSREKASVVGEGGGGVGGSGEVGE